VVERNRAFARGERTAAVPALEELLGRTAAARRLEGLRRLPCLDGRVLEYWTQGLGC
jgi:hypothetical protein